MIRIDILSQSPEEAVMRVCGEVWSDDEINLVAQEGNRCLEQSKLLVLDLEYLQALSDRALPQLQAWQAQGRLQIRARYFPVHFTLWRHGLASKPEGLP
jgi:hypothetical protein